VLVTSSVLNAFSQWPNDLPDSAAPVPSSDAHFDVLLNTWVLSRYADVSSALHCADLRPVAARVSDRDHVDAKDDSSRLATRAETSEALSPTVLANLDADIIEAGTRILAELPVLAPVEIIDAYGRPLCRLVATTITGISPSLGQLLIPDAEKVSAAAAEPFDDEKAAEAKAAGVRLRTHFRCGPAPLRHSGFVALSQTLCALLGNTWCALFQQPDLWVRLRDEPKLMGRAVEELLRYPGLTKMLFRIATADVYLNGVQIRKGQRIMLRIAGANRDPLRFADPEQVSVDRRPLDHLTLGSGRHSCVAGNLIRTVTGTATRLLVERYSRATLSAPVDWLGGSGFLFPAALHVVFTA
jgi:cytochrome P450